MSENPQINTLDNLGNIEGFEKLTRKLGEKRADE